MSNKDLENAKKVIDSNASDEEMENREICWTCSHLRTELGSSGWFTCKKTELILTPLDIAIASCEHHNNDRSKLRGTSEKLWKLLVALSKPVAIHSLPKSYIGAIGILTRYGLVNIFSDTTIAQAGISMFRRVQDKYIEAI